MCTGENVCCKILSVFENTSFQCPAIFSSAAEDLFRTGRKMNMGITEIPPTYQGKAKDIFFYIDSGECKLLPRDSV